MFGANALVGMMSSGWNLRGATYASKSYSVAAKDITPTGIYVKPDGSGYYICGQTNDKIYQYSMTNGDIDTSVFVSEFAIAGFNGNGLWFKPDGSGFLVVDGAGTLHKYTVTSWDITTAVLAQTGSTGYSYVWVNPAGTRLYYIYDSVSNTIGERSMTAWDISTLSTIDTFAVDTEDTQPAGLFLDPTGRYIYMVGFNGNDINLYAMSSLFDLTTCASESFSFSVASQDTAPYGIAFSADGQKMYVVGDTNDTIYQYSL